MRFGELPFVAALAVVAAIVLGGVAAVLVTGNPELVPVPFLAAVAFAAAYLYASHTPSRPSPGPDDEPFDDPVEEADRLADLPSSSPGAPGASRTEPPAPGGSDDRAGETTPAPPTTVPAGPVGPDR